MLPINTNTKNRPESAIYSPGFILKIKDIKIPQRIFLKTASEFDDKFILTTGNRWVFYYSGSRRYLLFPHNEITAKLTQYFCFKYASTKIPTHLQNLLYDWRHTIDFCIEQGEFSFATLRRYIENPAIDSRRFYSILFGLKVLCQEEFPSFSIDEYEELQFIPRPCSDHWDVYQEIDNIIPPLEKNMIVNGLFEMAAAITDGKYYKLQEVIDAVILGLIYTTGARPVQLSRLAIEDIRVDTRDVTSGLVRYSVLLPYAKQRTVTTERLFLSLPPEIGSLLQHYIERTNRDRSDKLFEMGASAPAYVSQAINQAVLRFSPPDYQAAVARGEAALPTITPTDLRHNVGHSLAMQGVSAEEIAHILGHSALVVAKHYILATPALALVRAKSLGVNPVWQNMVAMMLTGEVTSSAKWRGKRVAGIIGDQLHSEVGGCSRTNVDNECPFAEVRCCYGCLYYRPFLDGDHQAVLNSVNREEDELIELSDSVGNARNPLIMVHETTQLEIQSVINRCKYISATEDVK
ncbi:site-specific integrase [Aeromonas piscicola]|uniref:Site-specific integrase n=1 Tax=Aeromonas piscicola TaxID=600645 RepID=A0ABT7QBB2_9GAMM|nr:site-specific integrase [Aeromonas piscicola]MDM5131211.1 site-specific integrase [Aeromonas piscicola]